MGHDGSLNVQGPVIGLVQQTLPRTWDEERQTEGALAFTDADGDKNSFHFNDSGFLDYYLNGQLAVQRVSRLNRDGPLLRFQGAYANPFTDPGPLGVRVPDGQTAIAIAVEEKAAEVGVISDV